MFQAFVCRVREKYLLGYSVSMSIFLTLGDVVWPLWVHQPSLDPNQYFNKLPPLPPRPLRPPTATSTATRTINLHRVIHQHLDVSGYWTKWILSLIERVSNQNLVHLNHENNIKYLWEMFIKITAEVVTLFIYKLNTTKSFTFKYIQDNKKLYQYNR